MYTSQRVSQEHYQFTFLLVIVHQFTTEYKYFNKALPHKTSTKLKIIYEEVVQLLQQHVQ